jgi:hypothetical protein
VKPATEVEYVDAEARPRTIAVFTKMKRQQLEDSEAVRLLSAPLSATRSSAGSRPRYLLAMGLGSRSEASLTRAVLPQFRTLLVQEPISSSKVLWMLRLPT